MEKEPAMTDKSGATNNDTKPSFISGVIEGFYGRPWTTEQRKDLFRKLKKWGMQSYVYAPKDDYKHRAYWRELYTVEEADHLSGLIAAAKEQGIIFYYALSPGLDMTYSNQKELQALKRKLDQVSHFGCEAFALLFDDIESELCKGDKEVFETFANAQVSVTNEIYTHLGNPKFLFCPTQYCASRAVPTVQDSEYLNTLGSKLNNDIDILWTGNKVITKNITLESIQEVTEILRRPPVIWDNLHANDYDQKRVFLGPYSGRSPELIPHLRGVMTNPNCEFHANTIAIYTLAYWSRCNLDAKVNSSISADIKLETESEDDLPIECGLSKNVYHPRLALKDAIGEWLPEFDIEKEAWGPITKPQPQVQMVMPIIPIIPSINTCMSLTTTTTTSTSSKTVPEVNTAQLQALADACTTVTSSAMTPISNPVMNSLVSPTKVVTNDDILNPISTTVASNIELPKKIPISIIPLPIMHSSSVTENLANLQNSVLEPLEISNNLIRDVEIDTIEEQNTTENFLDKVQNENSLVESEDIPIDEKLLEGDKENCLLNTGQAAMQNESSVSLSSTGCNEPMECSSMASQSSPKEDPKTNEDVVMAETPSTNDMNNSGNSMQIEPIESPISTDEDASTLINESVHPRRISLDDLQLLCDLFYLPFEHGSRGFKLLNEFNWLKAHANVLLHNRRDSNNFKKNCEESAKPEVAEWLQRSETFASLCNSVQDLLQKIATCANKEICHDLYSYVWDMGCALSLLNAFVKWLSLGHFPPNVYTYTQGTYTWFSKGWKEAFMSGDQEPWVFRGGLIADLQRLMPVDSGNDLFIYKLPELPTTEYQILRPYVASDENEIYQICNRSYMLAHYPDLLSMVLPDSIRNVIADSIVGPFTTLSPEFCLIAIDNSSNYLGYITAALDINIFSRNIEMCWIPSMKDKYPKDILQTSSLLTSSKSLNENLTALIENFHNYSYQCPVEVYTSYPAILNIGFLVIPNDLGLTKRLLTVLLAALRSNGCFGAHVRLNTDKDTEQIQFYHKIGFIDIYNDVSSQQIYLGRRF